MARTSVQTTAERIRRQLASGHQQEAAGLFATIDGVVTTIGFDAALPAAVRAGTILGLESELVRVRTRDVVNNQVTVIRGYLDSDPVAHTAGISIDISPRFSMLDIYDAMQTEIDSWGQHLYYVAGQTFAVATNAVTLEMPVAWSNMLGLVESVQSETSTDTTVWPVIKGRLIRGIQGSFDGAPTSGILLRFKEPIRTGAVYLAAALPFSTIPFAPSADLVTDLKMTVSQMGLLEMGVKQRLLIDSENNRGARQAQDESRQAAEVPYGSMVSITQLALARYSLRRQEEVAKLRRLYPLRIS